ncbi:peptidoglycan DD-metalloendopeptidase family protein [Robbsia sp. KACC 23696]|uniref:peptidoglycan DD-metalloendopeptidase family protein n=1 Tax=Robbsia sp. KACC 23696 TaxID=3149231 RepID=UPI00325AAE01
MSMLMIGSGRSLWTHFQRGACVVALSALAACASRMDSAPVVDRTGTAPGLPTAGASNVPPGPPPPGFYQVQPGDTLYRVALKNGQNYRDIATWNNLTNPNQIEVGQVLRVAPPGSTPDSSGVTTTPLGGGAVQTAPLAGSASPYASPYASGGAPPANAGGYPSPYANGAGGAQSNTLAQNVPPPSYGPASTPGVTALPAAPVASAAAPVPPVAANGKIDFMWPVQGGGSNPILQRFDGVKSKGVDIGGTAGTPILAAAAGRVLYAGSELRGYGNLIIIKHDDHYLTAYGHNRTLLVKNNDVVTKGQQIAEMGDTQASRVELHFEVRKDSTPVDPLTYLPPR